MSSCSSHHPRSAVERLHLPYIVGGQGLVNMHNLLCRRLVILVYHLSTSSDLLVQLCSKLNSLLPPRLFILARVADYCSSLDVLSDWLSCTSRKIKEILHDKQLTSFTVSLAAKPLHRNFFCLLQSNTRRSVRWLNQHLHLSLSQLC